VYIAKELKKRTTPPEWIGMRIKDEVTKVEIEEIISGLECPKDFVCCKSGFEVLCKARDIRLESYVVCLEEDGGNCKFSTHFGTRHDWFYKCPLRVYIAKKLKK
jgi:hypothetical protein